MLIRRPWFGPAIVVVTLTLACRLDRTPVPPPPGGAEPELPTPVGLAPDGGIQRSRVIEVGRAQAYDANPGASHRALLDGAREVTIEPVEGAYRNSKEGFARGVVLARLVNHGKEPLPRFGLAPGGTAYWFFYRKGGELYSAYVADLETDKLDVVDVPIVFHRPTRPWRQSAAQWQLPGILDHSRGMGALGTVAAAAAGGEFPWVVCDPWGCCKQKP